MRNPYPKLRSFFMPLDIAAREDFAERCGTTVGHLKNIICGTAPAGEKLVISIDRESHGLVPVEHMRPDVDWAHLRGSRVRPRSVATA